MRTVDHVTGRALVRGLVNRFNDLLERLARIKAAFGLTVNKRTQEFRSAGLLLRSQFLG
jgi:hypothetical protein